jgi:hypothetical protein
MVKHQHQHQHQARHPRHQESLINGTSRSGSRFPLDFSDGNGSSSRGQEMMVKRQHQRQHQQRGTLGSSSWCAYLRDIRKIYREMRGAALLFAAVAATLAIAGAVAVIVAARLSRCLLFILLAASCSLSECC